MPRPKESPLFTLDEVTILRGHTRNLMDRVLFDIALDTAWPLWRILELNWNNIKFGDKQDWISERPDKTGKKLESVVLYRSGSGLRLLKTLYRPVTHDALFFDNKGDCLSEGNARKMFRQLGIDSDLGGTVFSKLRRTAEKKKDELRVFTQCPRCESSVNKDDSQCKRCCMVLNEKMANALLELRVIEKKKIDTFVYAEEVAKKYAEWTGEILGLVESVQIHSKILPDPADLEKLARVIQSYDIVHPKRGVTKKKMIDSWVGTMLAIAKIAQAAPAHEKYTQALDDVFGQAVLDPLNNHYPQQFLELHKGLLDGLSWIKRHCGVDFPVTPFLQEGKHPLGLSSH